MKRNPAFGAGLILAAAVLLASVLPGVTTSAGAARQSKQAVALGYYLVSADGTVASFGGAPNYGGLNGTTQKAPTAAMAVTPDGRGYWLVAENGSIHRFGDARFHGSLGNRALPVAAHRIIALVPTSDGKGYWICDASGIVHAFGDAPKLPSLKAGTTKSRIVGFAVAPNEKGAWVVTSTGVIYRLGTIRYYGGLGHAKLSKPIVALARNTYGNGYWMMNSAGHIYSFGAARKFSNTPSAIAGRAVGLAVAPSARGLWGASSGGSVLPNGVPSLGALSGLSGGKSLVAIATARPLATSSFAYDMLTSNGGVASFGGAGNFGGTESTKLPSAAVAMATTPDGRGYWITTANGSVYVRGNATWHGSLGTGNKPDAAHQIVAIVGTADGEGYWLCDASGVVHAYGDAPKLASLPSSYAGPRIVSFVVLPGETGALLADSAGDVYAIGSATTHGSLTGQSLAHPIVSMAVADGGAGYWLLDSAGDIFSFGAATAGPSPPSLTQPAAGIAAAPGGAGYWAVTGAGQVIPGPVPSRGDLSGQSLSYPVVAIAAALPIASTQLSPYPAGSIGYDVNWPQCKGSTSQAGSLPGPPNYPAGSRNYSIAFVGVDGWATGAPNTCLQAEVAWANKARIGSRALAPPYQLYMFINSPSGIGAADKTGPAGTCAKVASSARANCYAYNYGYYAGTGAVAYASSKGAHAPVWWLDVENDSCANNEWSDLSAGSYWSCTASLNDRVIQGAIDALRHNRIVVGVYSTQLQWNAITNHFVPSGAQLPLWIAGAPWTSPPYPTSDHYPTPGNSHLGLWCAGNYDFAGGVPSLLQETPGPNNYPFDPDYAC